MDTDSSKDPISIARENNDTVFADVCDHARQIALLESTAAAIEWDERTGMPAAAGEYRAQQIAMLRGMIHARQTDSRYIDQLSELRAACDGNAAVDDRTGAILRLHQDATRQQRLPETLVREMAMATTVGQQKWDGARSGNDWGAFAPALRHILSLKRDAAQLLAGDESECAYDGLLDEYEPGAKTSHIRQVFQDLREPLVKLVAAIRDSSVRPDLTPLTCGHALDAQRRLSRLVAERVGFD
ncbi:MAG: carboxypeptidase M32, partial [Planctomycetota bacterium]